MWKLNDEMIGRIQSYPKDKNNTEIWNELWLNRKTVRKYRQLQERTSAEAKGVLSWEEEQMRVKQKIGEKTPQLSKEDKRKLELLQHYSDKDIKEMLNYIATNSKKEIDKVIGEPWHLRLWMVSDTHFWAKGADIKWLNEFYKQAKDEWVECFVHAGDLVDWCHVYKGQQFEQEDTGYEDQVKRVVEDYPDVWLPTYFIGWNHDQSYLTSTWADITKTISSLRNDLVNLGFYNAELKLNGITIQLQHGGGGTSYSPDYKLLKYIDKIPQWKEPDIYALWHYHQAIMSLHRWIHGFMPWAWLKENLLCKRFWFGNIVWGWIIDITKDENWRKKLTTTFIEK